MYLQCKNFMSGSNCRRSPSAETYSSFSPQKEGGKIHRGSCHNSKTYPSPLCPKRTSEVEMFGRGQEVCLLCLPDPGLVESNENQDLFSQEKVCHPDNTITLPRYDGEETSAKTPFSCSEDPETVEGCPEEEGRTEAGRTEVHSRSHCSNSCQDLDSKKKIPEDEAGCHCDASYS